MKFKTVVLISLISSTLVWGYEDYLYMDYSIEKEYQSYDLVNNPAFLRLNNHEDLTVYNLNARKQVNTFRRTFDPEGSDITGLEIISYKALDDRSALSSVIVFETTRYNKMYRSLEKDFYSNYFSYTDTTTGDITYAGPLLRVVYNHEIFNNIFTGLQIDYGIERGLKEIYTKCETIDRNVNVSWGLGSLNASGSAAGISFRYFDRQGSYEAVKEITDAVVNTYMGYHIAYNEQPRSINEKKIYVEGVEIDGQLSINGFLFPSFKLDLSGGFGSKENVIDAGSSSKPTQRGYWVREGGFVHSILSLGKNPQRLGMVIMTGMKRYHDWASPRDYNVKNIENDINDISYGIKMTVPLWTSKLTLGYEAGIEDVDYREYTADFVFEEQLARSRIFSDFTIRMNQVMQMHYNIWFSEFEPWFYWNTQSIRTQGIEMGLERLFVFGRLGASLQIEFWKPEDKKGTVERFGIAISYLK